MAPWLAAAAAVALSVPGFAFTWLWDDFDFLGRAQFFRPEFLLPDPHTIFYRPLSREIYFSLVWWLGGGSPLLGHVGNAVLLGLAVVLIVSIGTRLTDRREGLFAGFAFAFFGAAPFLVAWVSGVQDLLALVLALAAIRLQLGGRSWAAALALLAGSLAKEVAVCVLPVAAALPWILGRPPARRAAHLLPYGVFLAALLSLHPAVRLLADRGLGAGEAGYVGLGVPQRGAFLLRTLLSLANLPVAKTAWPRELTPWLAAASLLAILGLGLLAARRSARRSTERPIPLSRILLLYGLLTLGPVLLTAGLVRLWAPYYSVIPAAGVALLLGAALRRLPLHFGIPILIVYGALGVWSRGAAWSAYSPCEANLQQQAAALQIVRDGFASLHPTLPPGTVALVSVGSTGTLGVYTHIHRFQALRVWYRDPSIVTRLPEQRPAGLHEEFLFRITSLLDVIEMKPDPTLFRSSGRTPRLDDMSRPTRSYARGVAASGDPERAARILLQLAQLEAGQDRDYDLRLAAMAWYAEGRDDRADSLVRAVPYPRHEALRAIGKIYSEPTISAAVDSCAFRAFGIAPTDTAAVRFLMGALAEAGHRTAAEAFARRMQWLVPGEVESHALLRSGPPAPERMTIPVAADSL